MSLETSATPAAAVGAKGTTSRRRSDAPQFTRSEGDSVLPSASTSDLASWIARLEKEFVISSEKMKSISTAIQHELHQGLQSNGQEIPMIPTYSYGYPTGLETGSYLAVDLGGTNLRVCHVTLFGQGKFEITQAKYRLSDQLKMGPGQALFDYCAESLGEFVKERFSEEELLEKIPLGFTFSYPCIQERIDHGVLLRWTKGFGATDVEGHDVAALFCQSLEKYQVPAILVALINDTTGTLIASAYVDTTTRIGVILGTGCNAAYVESVGKIPKLNFLRLDREAEMAINCEWGAFDSTTHASLPCTAYDHTIDISSNKPGEQAFEKMIAGLYLGEIFRLVLCEMVDDGVLFLGQETYKIEGVGAFETAFLSLIESDTTENLLTTLGLFTHFYALSTTLAERQFFKRLAELIGTRAARLSACGIAAIVHRKGYLEKGGKGCGVAADGSLYNKYPRFAERISEGLVDIFGEKGKLIKTHHAEDGSGVGAAIIAAMTVARSKNLSFASSTAAATSTAIVDSDAAARALADELSGELAVDLAAISMKDD